MGYLMKKVSDAQRRATNKYNAKTYEQLAIRLPKGERQKIALFAQEANQSLNSFVHQAIENTIAPKEETAMKIYTIVGGINGAGKSSLSGVLKDQRNDLGIIIDPDMMTAQLGGDSYEGGKAAVAMVDKCIESDVNFTQETTLSGSFPRKVARHAKEKGYLIRLYYVGIDNMEDSIQRIQNRVRRGGHDIPLEDIQRRYEKRFRSLEAILPYCNEAVFFDNDNGFTKVAEYKNGELQLIGQKNPKWLVELKQNVNI